jgi:hypothetical protein
VDDGDEVRRWRVKFLCSGFHSLAEGLLCFTSSSGSGSGVYNTGKSTRW